MPSPDPQPAKAAKLASTTPDATVTTTPARVPAKPLSPQAFWAALIVAAGLPVILLAIVIAVLSSLNYNFLNWME